MPGDILFYGRIQSDLADTVISEWTGSAIVHVAIAVSALLKVEALGGGIVKTPIDARAIYTSWYYHKSASPIVAENLSRALLWLDAQVGQMYGWGDIANAALAKFEHSVSIDLGGHYDCSGLATEFLLMAGGVPRLQGVDPHTITPSQLNTLLSVQ